MLPKGQRSPRGDAQPSDVMAGKTFESAGSFALKTGTLVPPTATVTHNRIETNAVSFTSSDATHSILTFDQDTGTIKSNIAAVSVTFEDTGACMWVIDATNILSVAALNFSALVDSGNLMDEAVTYQVGSKTLAVHFGHVGNTGGGLQFTLVFTTSDPSAFDITDNSPLMIVDVMSYD